MRLAYPVAVALAITSMAACPPAEAKGCIKGAIVGGAAGHLAHHGVLGAIGGCVVGHHMASEQARRHATAPENQQGAPAADQAAPQAGDQNNH